jgi:Bacterial sugar transferase
MSGTTFRFAWIGSSRTHCNRSPTGQAVARVIVGVDRIDFAGGPLADCGDEGQVDSRGPVLFRRLRVGKEDGCLSCSKFRTMLPSAAPYQAKPVGDEDWKVTQVAKSLRDWRSK